MFSGLLNIKVTPTNDDLEVGLTAEVTGEPPYPQIATSHSEFDVGYTGASVRFSTDGDGNMTLKVEMFGEVYVGKRTAE